MELTQGDIIWVNFNPSVGHEQKGQRPALVITIKAFNQATGFVWAIPITSKVKRRKDELSLPSHCKTHGVLLLSQVKALDVSVRPYELIENVGEAFLNDEVLGRIACVLGL